MSTPLCHLTLRATDSGALDREGQIVWVTNGTVCLGSRCAAWLPNTMVDSGEETGSGRCGLPRHGKNFPDPSRPTTRQTTRKVAP